MSRESQREPFLKGYTGGDDLIYDDDDEDTAKSEARHYRNVQRTGRNYLPTLMVIFITSFFWAGLFYLFHPSENAHSCSSSSTSSISSSSSSSSNARPTTDEAGNPLPHENSAGFQATIPIATTPHISTTHPDDNSASKPLTLPLPVSPSSVSAAPIRLNMTSDAHLLTCGTTPAEALAQNCTYDILLNNWVPQPCFSQEFVDEYVDEINYSAANGWGGFRDENLTMPLSLKEMSEVPFYWTSLRDHVVHCAVMWKKQFATMFEFEGKGVLDTVLASSGHTDHCAQYLMDFGLKNWTGATKTEMGFAGCWVKNEKN